MPTPPRRTLLRNLLRPAFLPALLLTVLLLVALLLLVVRSWSNLERLQPLDRHAVELQLLQTINLELQVTLVESFNRRTRIGRSYISLLRNQVREVLTLGSHLAPETPQRLRRLLEELDELQDRPSAALTAPLEELRQVIEAETRAHNALLGQAQATGRLELWVALAVALLFPLLAMASLWFLRRRIWAPLQDLGDFMALLAEEGYRRIPTRGVDPLLAPLFHRYNALVQRLEELERRSQARRASLEEEVRNATRGLLQYQRDLAGAERLAALGELAAGLAHDLRNPLAGVQMALNNLRGDLTDPEHVRRLSLAGEELTRITRLLNDLLSRARHEPEPLNPVRLAHSIGAVLALARYQIPRRIEFDSRVPEDLFCRLPDNRLRQALLNLLLNAAQSIGGAEGRIDIRAERVAGRLCLSVADDGAGFPPELLAQGGRPFVTLKDQGTGLGLAMVRRFVRDLNGTLHLANRTPRGARVTLELPCGHD